MSDESSNFIEFKNWINAIKREGEEGCLQNTILLFCTDNAVVERAIYNGTSSFPKLLDIVIKVYNFQQDGSLSNYLQINIRHNNIECCLVS